jgi:pyruvate/2-oxoacid:ferredoxin oxidoreductase alpha subunit
MSFRDDGGIMLAPKGIQEYVPALYLARLLTHFAKMPVIVSIGGITDTHKIGLVKVPPDDRVRSWLRTTLKEFDYLEHKLVNRQGDIVVHGPSGTSAVYQESQSEIEKAHRAAAAIAPYAVRAVHELTGVWLDELEAAVQRVSPGGEAVPGSAETVMILQGSLYPNAVEALRELEEDGWTGMGCLSVRTFNPFPEERLFPWFEGARRLVVLDRSNSFGSVPPLAARIFASLARWQAKVGRSAPLSLRTLVGGLGGREITVREMKEILLSTHLLFHRAEEWEPPLIAAWLAEDTVLQGLVNEAAALEVHNTNRHTRVPRHLRAPAAERDEYGERVASLGRELTAKNYATLLANYHHVEFVAPREFLEETALLQQLVLYVEVRLARHAAGSGRGSRRHGQILCHYSQDPRDQEMAAGLLQQQPILPASGVVVMPVGEVAGQAGAPPAALPQTSGALESGAPPAVVSFDAREAERIVTILSELVVLHGEEPLYYNPEDFEHELLRRLQNAPDSPLHRLSERLPGPQADDLLWGYRCCYRDLIDHTLQREILTQHHAPELRELFYEEGRARLVALARHFAVHLQEVEPAAAAKIVQGELERYLNERILPHYPKHALFYLEYFRNWVAPGVLAEHRH